MAKMTTNNHLEKDVFLKIRLGNFLLFFYFVFIMDLTTRNQRKKWSTPSLNIALKKVSCPVGKKLA